MILYTSDLHFGHANVIGFDNRPFSDVDEMDRNLIEMWNARVQMDDTVYIVGDLCYRNSKPAEWYLSKLKGHKILILGNHDDPIINNAEAHRYLEGLEQMKVIKDGDVRIHLSHFPMAGWRSYHRGSYHIFGHIHNRKNETYEIMKKLPRALNAGCMINNYMPASFEELIRNKHIRRRRRRTDLRESVAKVPQQGLSRFCSYCFLPLLWQLSWRLHGCTLTIPQPSG